MILKMKVVPRQNMMKLKKNSQVSLFLLSFKAFKLLVVFISISTLTEQSIHAQVSNLEEIANKAESFYPSKLDSAIYHSNLVIQEIRKKGLESPLEEKMLDLMGWANRRKGEIELAEQFLTESLTLSQKKNNLEQLGSTYNRLGLLFRGTSRFDEALSSYQKSIEIRTQLKDDKGISGTLNNLGNLYRAMGERGLAFDSFTNSITIKEKIGDEAGAANSYLNLGNWMAAESDFDKALIYYSKFREIQEELKDTVALSMVIFNTGNIFFDKGNYEKALQNYLESLAFLEKAKNSNQRLIASRYLSIGNIYERLSYPDLAIQNYKTSLSIYQKFQDSESIGDLFLNIGKVFENLNEPDSALSYYEMATSKYETLNNQVLLAEVYQNIGVIYNQVSSPEFALNYLQKAEKIYENTDHRNLSNVYNSIGASYFSLKNYINALSYYEKSLQLATQDHYLEVQHRATSGLSETYAVLNDYENAFKYQTQFDMYKDSLYNIEKSKTIEELITKYETEKVEAENKLLIAEQAESEALIEKRSAENKLLLLGLVALIGAIIGGIAWTVYSSRKKRIIAEQKEMIYQKEIDSLLNDQQLKTIGAMLEGQDKERKRLAAELHDRLGSILSLVKLYFSSLNEDIKTKQPDLYNHFQEGNKFLDDAFDEVRAIIKEMHEGKISGNGLEKDVNELLAKIGKIGVNIKSNIRLKNTLDNNIEVNIFRIIQEGLSNALKYSKASVIELLLIDGEILTLKIKDNGIGFDPTESKISDSKRESYGVGNMKSRVKLLGGNFDLNTAKGEGVDIHIQIPLVKTERVEEMLN